MEGQTPVGDWVQLTNPSWERRLVKFLHLSRVGRVMADGMDEDAVCLFVVFSFYVLHPEGVCGLFTKETGRRPCVRATTKEIPRPQGALCAILGVCHPLTKLKKKVRKRNETKRGLDGDVLRRGLSLRCENG
jgi:hypothetical protein